MRIIRNTLPALPVAMAVAALLALVTPAPVHAGGLTHQHADVLALEDSSDVGDTLLLRSRSTINTVVSASGVEPGAYTMWWVVWNAPENCATPFACAFSDLDDPDTQAAVGYAGGGLTIGSHDALVVRASLREGETLQRLPTEFGWPLVDAMADTGHAEVNLVLRSHGEPVPGSVEDQQTTYNGGCVYQDPITGTAPAYGEPGPNTCEDLYVAVFPSPDAP